ncbi:MAG: MBL fold metallo-hydrolase [Marinilabiliaceae bacterium]|jgi:7,8-dihydropterin-6-yl-methyl-4-(beta-D-ribofuranosyl)aminobenzene 5'-phosphate synthase|nr:MBL fold metallo-hydrolase [Marinilabiliaceae bacterium]
MRISILTENSPGTYTQAEHGLSYLVEYDSKKILFDTGQSELYLQNAQIMNIDLGDIDLIVLSHGHYDHGNGLRFLERGILLCHPECFQKRYGNKGEKYIGLGETKKDLLERFELLCSEDAYRISEKIYFLGAIPRISEFESHSTSFTFEDGSPDYVRDDSALALVMDKGLFVISGCGHSGIINTFERAKEVTGVDSLFGIIGGFHLKKNNTQAKETIKYLKENKVKHVYPSHCTAMPALCAFYREFGKMPPKTGDIMEF